MNDEAAISVAGESYATDNEKMNHNAKDSRAPEGEWLKEITRSGGCLGGGFLGAAVAGAALGAHGANPITVLAGMAIGGIAGAIVGKKSHRCHMELV